MYKCLSTKRFEDDEGYALVPLRQEDMESIRVWRNDQIDILRQQTPILPEQQQAYFNDVVAPLFQMEHPQQILFSYLLEGNCIGYGGLTYLDWTAKRGEISFLVDTLRSADADCYNRDFRRFLEMMKMISFDVLHLHRIFAETFSFRPHHATILEDAGFQLEGKMREHVFKKGEWVDSYIHGYLASEYYA